VQYACLKALKSNPGVDATRLSALIAFDRSTIGNVLERLERKGLIQRFPSADDKRIKLLKLDPQGRLLLRRLEAAVERSQKKDTGAVEHGAATDVHEAADAVGRRQRRDLADNIQQQFESRTECPADCSSRDQSRGADDPARSGIDDLPPDYVQGLRSRNTLPLWPALRTVLPYGAPIRRTLPVLRRYREIRPDLLCAPES
jgi:DNA-binding MarR family transcriptional regulator